MSYKDWQALAEQEAKVPKMIIESIDYAEKIIDHVADELQEDVDHFPLELLKTIVEKAWDRALKYRWHDLRKNPDDIPDMGNDVLMMIRSEGDGEFPLVGKYSYGDWKFSLPDSYHVLDGIYDVIAWREIEPFEVSE